MVEYRMQVDPCHFGQSRDIAISPTAASGPEYDASLGCFRVDLINTYKERPV